MAENDKILEKDIVDKKVYQIGSDIEKSLKPASEEVDRLKKNWLEAMSEIKKSALEFGTLQKNFKVSEGYKDFIQLKNQQTKAIDTSTNAIKLEKQTFTAYTQERIKLEKQLITSTNKTILAEQGRTDALVKQRYELQILNRNAKEAAVLSSSLSTEYEKQSVKLTILRRRYKDVALVEGETSKNAKVLRAEITKLDTTLKKVDSHVGQFQRNVGNYGKAMQSAAAAARTMMSAMGFAGGAYLFVNVMRDAFERVREFDKSMQNLAGVFRTTRKELAPLEADIISVAGTSVKTSNEVANLAETLATLGKSPEQIQKLLKPVVDLGIGLEATGDEAGEFLIQMLNTFGASEDEALKYADTIATIRTSTSLDFQKMRDSFQYLAPISQALNKDLAYTGSLVGILADNGIKAERAGRLLGTSQQKLAAEGKTLTDALDELNKAKEKGVSELELLKLASELFGKQSAALGVVLANNSDIIDTNAQAIRDNGGALDDLVKEQLNSLDAKLKILDSSWEELILTIENGEGSISQAYKGFIEIITSAIQRTTELEKAQGRVFEVTGRDGESGMKKFLNTLLPPLRFINSEYDDLVEKQKEFDKINKTIDNNGLLTLEGMYERLNKEIKTNNDLTIDQEKLYQKQLVFLGETIDKRKLEEKAIRDQAEALGYAGEIYSSSGDYQTTFDIGIDKAAISDLKRFVALNSENTDETKKNADAQNKLSKEQEKVNKALEKRLKLLAQDKHDSTIAFLQSEIEAEKTISENEDKTYSERLLANNQFYNAKKQLLETQKAFEIEENKDRKDKIAQIELQYDDELLALQEEKQKRSLELLKSYFEKELKVIQDAEQEKKDAQNNDIGQAQLEFKTTVTANPTDYSAQLAAKEKYEKDVAEIEKKYALESIQAQINAVKKLQEDKTFNAEQQKELAKQLSALEIAESNITTENILDDIEKEKEAREQLQEFKRQMFANFSNGLASALEIDSAALNDFFNSVDSMFGDMGVTLSNSLETLAAASEVTRDIISSVYQANIEDLESQLDAMNEYYDAAFERAEGDKIQQDLIREEQRLKEQELKKQIAKEKTKAAEADKKAAIIQAGINTALAITSALTQTPPLSYVMAALSAAMGLAQIAIIASKPIPKFKEGHLSGTHKGWAITNDGGRDEVHERKDGSAYVIKGRNVPVYMDKGDKIHKSVDDYRQMYRASVLASVEINNNKLKDYEADRAYMSNEEALREEMALTRKVIEKTRTKVIVNQTKPRDLGHELYRLRSLE